MSYKEESIMKRTRAISSEADKAYHLVEALQKRLVEKMEALGTKTAFEPVEWFRDEGRHGGGVRYEATDESMFNRASVNISQVHYDDSPSKKLASATALSAIIHPQDPHAPSVHMHFSWTELREGRGYWRLMADLNPSIEELEDTLQYSICLQAAAAGQYDEAEAQGDRYFYIPALKRHRGSTHFYLEEFNSSDSEYDLFLSEVVGNAAIDCYVNIMRNVMIRGKVASAEDETAQLAYHTLYLLQVLTLDRGTTSGLLIHDQNDVGILASLPAKVDRELLISWTKKLPVPQNSLLQRIIEVLPHTSPSLVDEDVKLDLARVVREHYRLYPKALTLQASGGVLPTTVDNHK